MTLPLLPEEISKKHLLGTVAFISYSLTLYLGGAIGTGYLINGNLPIVAKIIIILPFLFITQQGLHLLGLVGHDGIHGNLHHNRICSVVVGILFSSMVVSFLAIGFAITHWKHHKNTNKLPDPDTDILSRYQNLWNRFLLSRFPLIKGYRKYIFQLCFDRFTDWNASPFKPNVLKRLAQWNLFCAACWLSVYLFILIHWPLIALVSIIIPHILASGIAALRADIEHSETKSEPFKLARSYTSPVYTLLMFGNNFHLEHHFYPNVPCYRLPSVHKWLKESGFFKNKECFIDDSILGPWQYTLSQYQYPRILEPTKSEKYTIQKTIMH